MMTRGVLLTITGVRMELVSITTGCVMDNLTVKTDQMKLNAVSYVKSENIFN